jgi:hypothetical protein
MGVEVRTKPQDAVLKQIIKALKDYAKAHPNAEITVYRHNSVSVRIRVIDSAFANQSRAVREEELWGLLNQLPEDVSAEISLLLLLTPEEAPKSLANIEFENPIPSRL